MEFKARFPCFFTFFRGVYFLLTGNTKASDLKGDHLFIKAYMHIRYLIANNYFDLYIPN